MLSVLILTKNEERNIERAIKSVQGLAKEVVVVDSGSTDRTVEIARGLGAKVFFREWEGYASQLNYGIELCSGDWVLVIDADEEVSQELRESIRKELKNPAHEVYMLSRKTYYLGGFLNHAWYPEWRVRLFRKRKVRFEGVLHETPIYTGSVGKLRGDLYHYSYEDLEDQYVKTVRYARKMAELMKEKGKRFRLYNLILNPLWHFVKVYFVQMGFLDGLRGFLVAFSALFYTFLKYKFLYELELKDRKPNLW
ncbi:MAG: glycosyltransferase family 2 protein [Aquificaceae bacterium]|uniref:glycosyltransferase family 2 protein n=1 Tax=Hydrogenobacter sp. Uz 6-8 TaxID=3384828 RepID=UPI00309B8D09